MDLRVGQVEGEAPYLFGEIADVALDTAGRIYVADRQASEIRVFDRSGRYLFTAGREGEGPGEFSGSRGAYEPCEITVEPGGRIWAKAGDRLEVFAVRESTTTHLATVSLEPHLECEPLMLIDSTAVTVVHTTIDSTDRTEAHLRVNLDGERLSRVTLPDLPSVDSLRRQTVSWRRDNGHVVRVTPTPPFPAYPIRAHAPNGRFATTITSSYRIVLSNRRGQPAMEIQRSVKGPELTAHERDSVRGRLDSLQNAWRQLPEPYPDYKVPERKNPIRNIWFDAEERLWVQVWTHASRGENEAHVYSGDGDLQFTVTWPIGIDLRYGASRGRVILGTTEDELGVQRVVRLRLR